MCMDNLSKSVCEIQLPTDMRAQAVLKDGPSLCMNIYNLRQTIEELN
jgi:hypothetical protein